jgi:hypothetical protein
VTDDPVGSSFLVYTFLFWKHYDYHDHRRLTMNLPTIHTNIWDAVIAIPVIILLTQLIKLTIKPPSFLVPNIAVLLGLLISIFISHKGHFVVGTFMGFFYGYAAIGNYSSLKTTVLAYRKQREVVR